MPNKIHSQTLSVEFPAVGKNYYSLLTSKFPYHITYNYRL